MVQCVLEDWSQGFLDTSGNLATRAGHSLLVVKKSLHHSRPFVMSLMVMRTAEWNLRSYSYSTMMFCVPK